MLIPLRKHAFILPLKKKKIKYLNFFEKEIFTDLLKVR